MSNFGNIQMSFITSKKHPLRALKTIFLRKISYRLILLLMIFRVLPQIDIRFLTNRQIYNDIHNNVNKKLGKKGKNNSSLNYIKKLKRKLININLNDDKLYKVDF